MSLFSRVLVVNSTIESVKFNFISNAYQLRHFGDEITVVQTLKYISVVLSHLLRSFSREEFLDFKRGWLRVSWTVADLIVYNELLACWALVFPALLMIICEAALTDIVIILVGATYQSRWLQGRSFTIWGSRHIHDSRQIIHLEFSFKQACFCYYAVDVIEQSIYTLSYF